MTPTELFEKLRGESYAWLDLSHEEQQLAASTLRPLGAFTSDQTELLRDWYLTTTKEGVEAINVALQGTGNQVPYRALRATSGAVVIRADLLTDALRPRDTYFLAGHLLGRLPFVYLTSEDFPPPATELE